MSPKESVVSGGRIAVYVPDHPAANNRGYIQRSRYRMEKIIGRRLKTEEHVHHKDGDKTNDADENLEIKMIGDHTKHHKPWENTRKMDYDLLSRLRLEGFGYKRIAKATGYPLSSVKSAVRVIEKKRG